MTFESYSNDVEVMKGRLLGWLDELFLNLDPVEVKTSEHDAVTVKIPVGRLTIHIVVALDTNKDWTMFGVLTDNEGGGRDCPGTDDISLFGLARILVSAYQKALECGAEEKP